MTTIERGNALARKAYSVGLFTTFNRSVNDLRNMSGPLPTQAATEKKMKFQSTPDMPVVTCSDLSKSAGDKVSIDLVNIIGGKPIMNDKDAEGKGESLTFSSQDIELGQTRKPVKAGGKMTQQRTVHTLRTLALTAGNNYMQRIRSQLCWVHLAGARGSQNSVEWAVPLQTDSDFSEICVNSILAPSYNRHYVVDGNDLIQGGLQLGSIDSADAMKLVHIDLIRQIIDDADFTLQPVRIEDDPAKDDDPLYVLWMPPRVYNTLLRDTTANGSIRQWQANAWSRKSLGSKHPLFAGDCYLWNGILMKKMPRAIRFLPSESTQVILVANRYTGTESAQTVNAGLTAGYAVERSILVGAQALGEVLGRNQESDGQFFMEERRYDFRSKLEICVGMMNGMSKIRFKVPDNTGVGEVTDHGAIVIDSAVKL